jgi:hypothetical protein
MPTTAAADRHLLHQDALTAKDLVRLAADLTSTPASSPRA